MCGLVGYWSKKKIEEIEYRGPDDFGIWHADDECLAFGHRRLSIVDLSSAGHQPMLSPCGRYALVYNGEIYNHAELRATLEIEGGHFNWRGHSDTETLLAGLRHWGVENTLKRINGMFAFALWDAKESCLFLARDRMGEKPLYYGLVGNSFLFGSELKCMTAHPEWKGGVDRGALSLYLRYNYVPAPWSIYQGIYKLPPAHFVEVRDAGQAVSPPKCYWNLEQIASEGATDTPHQGDDLIDDLDSLLRDSVSRRMMADVPLGAFLSGGIDSSTVVALMQAESTRPVKTFTIGFHESDYDEAAHARAVATHLGTEHTDLYLTPEESLTVVPRLPLIWDEPFADASQIPTLLLSQLAREHVTVSLSGDGGDELFCGYNRYTQGYQLWKTISSLPSPLRLFIARLLQNVPAGMLDNFFQTLPGK